MHIRTYPLGPLQTNAYLLTEGALAVAVDPGGDPAPLLRALREGGQTLSHVLLTHLHFDHLYGVRDLAEKTGAAVLGPADDAFLMETELGRGGLMGLPTVAAFDYETIAPGEAEFLGLACRVLPTPGHTPGSLSYYFPSAGAVFVGDLLFARSVGRTDFPGGDSDTLLASVRERIFTLPPETVVHPGHGPQTTVGDEMHHNPFFNGL
ncbi:MAG: MBL fold metallo-hydrolase [Desulfovibrionaceae bacterium]